MNVKEAIEELINQAEMFTAYDVTIHLRNNGEHVEHYDVKSEVHDLYAVGQLTSIDRTIITIPGTVHKAYLYYSDSLEHDDLLGYSSVKPTYAKGQKVAVAIVTRNKRNRQPRNGLLEGAKADSKGHLNIPTSMVREMFSEYNGVDAYKVDHETDKIIVSAQLYGKKPMLDSAGTSRNRIRIDVQSLGKDEFNIEMVDGDIVIT